MRQNGFTVFELMVVSVIITVILVVTVPLYKEFHKRQEADRVVYSLQSLMTQARAYASTSHLSLTLCGSSDTQHCDADWATGALLIEDGNRNGNLDGDDRILQFLPLHIQPSVLVWRGFSGNRLTIETVGTTFASNGTFTYCREDQEPPYRRQVVINRGGRARISRDSNGDGIHEDSSGNPIRCP